LIVSFGLSTVYPACRVAVLAVNLSFCATDCCVNANMPNASMIRKLNFFIKLFLSIDKIIVKSNK
jgi:hypothetical protein